MEHRDRTLPDSRLRIGLIGCGRIVEIEHLPAMLRSERVELVGCADTTPGRAANVGALAGLAASRCHEDYHDLLARDDVDVVSIAVPPSVRAQVVIDAARAGKHAVCEKPFALSLAEADAMLAAFDDAGRTLAMYHNYLYYSEHRLTSRLIAEGRIGDVVRVEICGPGSRPSLGAEGFQPNWRWDPVVGGGGVTMDIGVHAFYLCELFLPEPVVSVSAAMRFAASGVDDHAFCLLRTGAGQVARVDVAWGQGSSRFEIGGTAGFISYVYDEGAGYFGSAVRAVRVGSVEGETVVHKVPPGRSQFTPQIYDDLAAALSGTAASYPAYGRDGRRAVEIAHAAYRSAETGESVHLPLGPEFALYEKGPTAMLLAQRTELASAR